MVAQSPGSHSPALRDHKAQEGLCLTSLNMTAFLWARVTNVGDWQPRPLGYELDQGYHENKTRRAANGRKSKTCSLPEVHTDKLYLEAFGKTESDSQYLDTLSDSHSFQRAHMIDP